MYTTGLVFALSTQSDLAEQACLQLAEIGPFTLGDCHQSKSFVPVVLETENAESAHNWHELARQIPGIEHVEVVFVYFDDFETQDANG